ncbi:class I histocompatibility antigen, F10 alpha chain-like [Dromaius novaehollandiae]|uniref:class I histocompatibility antigen, F10 alpha chain-like n=1 Tax=Dromaius novaehollandiae TaxID=8790 RepID=UPI00311FFBA3
MATERLEAAAGPGAGELPPPPPPPYTAWAPAELQATLADIDAPAQELWWGQRRASGWKSVNVSALQPPTVRVLLGLVEVVVGSSSSANGPHSLRYFNTAVTKPSPGLPAFISVGYVDGELIDRYDSEMQRVVPGAAWMEQEGQDHWDEETRINQDCQETFRVYLDTLQKRYNQSGGYHTVQRTYGCDLLEDGGTRGFMQLGYDGKDFIAFDKDTLTFVTADAAALITKRKWEAENEPERWKHYLENSCIEGLRRYVEHGRAALVRRPMVRVSAKESHGFVTLSCRAHGFYPRPISISWLKKGRIQAQETKRGSVTPNGDGTYHAWASIEGLPAEKHEYQCCMEHASLPEPGLFSWEPPSSLLPIVLGAVIAVVVVIAVWKSRWGRKEQGYVIAKGSNAAI